MLPRSNQLLGDWLCICEYNLSACTLVFNFLNPLHGFSVPSLFVIDFIDCVFFRLKHLC